ncbi:MAG: hypothetical protein ACREDL_16620 [Bradyrhizobium sp.]
MVPKLELTNGTWTVASEKRSLPQHKMKKAAGSMPSGQPGSKLIYPEKFTQPRF